MNYRRDTAAVYSETVVYKQIAGTHDGGPYKHADLLLKHF